MNLPRNIVEAIEEHLMYQGYINETDVVDIEVHCMIQDQNTAGNAQLMVFGPHGDCDCSECCPN